MHISGSVTSGILPNPRVLLIENDEAAASEMMRAMERAGLVAAWAKTGAEGLALKSSTRPHVVVLDLSLPDISGMALLARLAEGRDCGIVVVSGMCDEADRIVGLELGADDYMAKPPGLRELVARIRAVHRRVSFRAEPRTVSQPTQVLKVGPIRINILHRTVHTQEGRRLQLTSAEFSALETLANAGGAAVSRDKLSEAALRRPWRAEDRSVDQLVFNLRQKLPADEGGGMLIQSIRGSGYWLRAPESMIEGVMAEETEMAA